MEVERLYGKEGMGEKKGWGAFLLVPECRKVQRQNKMQEVMGFSVRGQ